MGEKIRFITAHAQSVSERIWQLSHGVRPHPVHLLHTLVSQALVLQSERLAETRSVQVSFVRIKVVPDR